MAWEKSSPKKRTRKHASGNKHGCDVDDRNGEKSDEKQRKPNEPIRKSPTVVKESAYSPADCHCRRDVDGNDNEPEHREPGTVGDPGDRSPDRS